MTRAPDELAGEQDDPVTAQLDQLSDQEEPEVAATAGRRLIEAGLWAW